MPVLPANSSTRTQLEMYQLLAAEYNLKIKAYELAQNKYEKA
jgi:hypothetical protein